jgi:hypothetical protein
MRIDLDECRDPDLLAAEVRRLRAVIAASELPLTDEERNAIAWAATVAEEWDRDSIEWAIQQSITLRSLLERTK